MARHSLLLIVADTYVHCRVRWMVGWSRCNHNDWKKSIQTYQAAHCMHIHREQLPGLIKNKQAELWG